MDNANNRMRTGYSIDVGVARLAGSVGNGKFTQ